MMADVHRPAKKAVCIVCDAVFLCFSSKAMFCCDQCRVQGMAEMDYNERHRRHQAAREKLEKQKEKPASLETIASWQVQHKRITGEWLGYPKAVEQMRKEGYVV